MCTFLLAQVDFKVGINYIVIGSSANIGHQMHQSQSFLGKMNLLTWLFLLSCLFVNILHAEKNAWYVFPNYDGHGSW